MSTVDNPLMEVAEPKPSSAFQILPAESMAVRWLYVVLGIGVAAGFFYFTHQFWAPAHGGVDQNGYLVGGKMLANHGSMSLSTVNPITGKVDPYLFVGEMWIGADLGTKYERYYPKYPMGLPAIYALVLKLGGEKYGPWSCFLVDPVMMTLGILGTFFLIR